MSYIHQVIISVIIFLGILFLWGDNKKSYIPTVKFNTFLIFLSPILILFFIELFRVLFFPMYDEAIILYILLYISSPIILLLLINSVNYYSFLGNKTFFYHYVKPYVILSNVIVILSVLVFFLALVNIINVESHPIFAGLNQWTDNNNETLGSKYYFPFNMAVIIDSVRVPFLNQFGIFCGLSHEPHIATLLITPSFFLLKYFYRSYKYYLLAGIYVFFMLIATSTTNILIFLPLFFLYKILETLYSEQIIKKSKKNIIYLTFFILLLIVSVPVLNDLLNLFESKIYGQAGGSLGYSINMLTYIIEPKTILGYGVWRIPYPNKGFDDIGFLGMVGMFAILFVFLKLVKDNLFSKKNYAIGIAGLYFVLHSLKIPQHTIIYPFTYYILFLLIMFRKNTDANS